MKVGTSSSYVNRLIKNLEKIVSKFLVQMAEKLGYDIKITYAKR